MGKIAKHNQPCLDVDKCGSSDAMQVYEDGGAKCFSCGRSFTKKQMTEGLNITPSPVQKLVPPANAGFTPVPTYTSQPQQQKITKETIKDLKVMGFPDRDLTRAVCEFYDVKAAKDGQGNITHHVYPYNKGAAYKVRVVGPKEFLWIGTKPKTLFGQEKFPAGGRSIVLTEGECDTLAMQQANLDRTQKTFPVVGLPSSSDLDAVVEQREYLRSFGKVIVCMDDDEAGQKALDKILKIVGYDKCRVMVLPANDINDVLKMPDGAQLLTNAMFSAQERTPAGIVTHAAIRQAIIDRANTPSHPYSPVLAEINRKVKGKRGGEIALFISGTGCGKSTIFREEILHVLKTTPADVRVGVVSLEEAVGETGQKLSAMSINRNPSDDTLAVEDVLRGFDELFTKTPDGEDRVMLLDHQGAITDNTIMDQLEYMCQKGCKYIFLDHITILVSEGVDGLTGNEAQDKVMNDLLRLVKRYPDVWIGLISHLRKAPSQGATFESGKMPGIDDIRGSGSIKQISFDIFAFARDTTAASEQERNLVKYAVLKCRWNGNTGPAGRAMFSHKTGRMSAITGGGFEEVEVVQVKSAPPAAPAGPTMLMKLKPPAPSGVPSAPVF